MPEDDDDFDDAEPELDDDVDIEDEDEALDLETDVVAEVDEVVEEVEDEVETPRPARPKKGAAADETPDEDEDDVVDLEEEHHPDDVEAPLDALLHERTKADRLEEEAIELEDDELDTDVPGEATGRVVPRRDDEFLCRSCFLVKPLSQLARGEKDLCRDCE
jgi:hypothetical protein